MHLFAVRVDSSAVADAGSTVAATAVQNRALRQIVIASVLLRVVWALLQGSTVTALPGVADQLSYHALALRVVDGYGFTFDSAWWPATEAGQPTAHWSYLYVLLISTAYALLGPAPVVVRLLQSVLVGILQPLLTYRIAGRLFGRRVAVVSAAIVACYAYFVYYGGMLMTESLYIVAILWSIDTAQRLARSTRDAHGDSWLWLQLGLAIATGVLLRQVLMLMVPFVLGWIIWHRIRVDRTTLPAPRTIRTGWLRGSMLTTAVILSAIAPWTIRNYRAFNEFVPLNTNAGFAFYWGNHPVHGTSFIPILPGEGSAYGRLIPPDLRGLSEARIDRALLRRGLGFVVAEPVRYLRLSISRIKEYVRFWPTPDGDVVSNLARAVSFGLCLPFFIGGIVLVLRVHWRGAAAARSSDRDPTLLLAFAAGYSVIHFLTWTLVRYRLPVDALLIPFAAFAMVWLHDTLRTPARFISREQQS